MHSRSWTDDLPKCQYTGVAYPLTNDGKPEQVTDAEDFRCFYCQSEDATLYGVFDAHNGKETAQMVLQHMAAEILLGQLKDKYLDEEIKDLLRNAFLSVEKEYMKSIDGVVAEKTSLQFEFHEEEKEQTQSSSAILEKLKKIDFQLSMGATSVIALIHSGKLYVANIGESRALLCKTDDNCVLRVVQLSVDHSLTNEDELLRLSQLGLDIHRLREAEALGNQASTRCIGNYLVKGLYRAFPDMRTATSEPVIAIPEVHGPINLDESCRFLILMSDGLYKSLEESTDTEQVNKRFAQMVVEQFRIQPSLSAVCQAVVNKAMDIYQEYCLKASKPRKKYTRNTLMIRNFNFQLPNAPVMQSPLVSKKNNTKVSSSVQSKPITSIPNKLNQIPTLQIVNDKKRIAVNEVSNIRGNERLSEDVNRTQNVRFNPIVQSHSHNAPSERSDVESYSNGSSEASVLSNSASQSAESCMSTITPEFSHSSSLYDSSSTSDTSNNNRVQYDPNLKIEAYVDFTQYYENVKKARLNGTLPPGINFD